VTGSTVLLQFSDLHIGEPDHERDPAAAFAAASEIGAKPAGVLLSGDLTENGQDGEYELVAELVERLRVPVYPLPGNHDDREALRRSFALPGTGAEPILYTADAGELRLIVLPRSLATWAIGRSDSSARRTPRSLNSSGYFLLAGTRGGSPLARTDHPRFEVSMKAGMAHEESEAKGAEATCARKGMGTPARVGAGGFCRPRALAAAVNVGELRGRNTVL
jgi:hypothetical protein